MSDPPCGDCGGYCKVTCSVCGGTGHTRGGLARLLRRLIPIGDPDDTCLICVGRGWEWCRSCGGTGFAKPSPSK